MASLCFGGNSIKLPMLILLFINVWGYNNVAHLSLIQIKNNLLWNVRCNYTFSFYFYRIQVYEYRHAPFQFLMVFSALFLYFNWVSWYSRYYGTIFIFVQLMRLARSILHIKSLRFWSRAWYWHFVDVVWLLLFVIVYLYGSSSFDTVQIN